MAVQEASSTVFDWFETLPAQPPHVAWRRFPAPRISTQPLALIIEEGDATEIPTMRVKPMIPMIPMILMIPMLTSHILDYATLPELSVVSYVLKQLKQLRCSGILLVGRLRPRQRSSLAYRRVDNGEGDHVGVNWDPTTTANFHLESGNIITLFKKTRHPQKQPVGRYDYNKSATSVERGILYRLQN